MRFDLLGGLFQGWAAIYCGHRNPSARVAEVFHLKPFHISSLPGSLDYRREPILLTANEIDFLFVGENTARTDDKKMRQAS